MVLKDSWILQNPLFFDYGSIEGYLPEEKIAIAIASTYGEASFDDQGDYQYGNASQRMFERLAEHLAPGSVPRS